jgi:flagellar biosynthetic protein FliR
MISLSDAQFDAWLAAYLFPLARILGLVATAPLFDNAALTVRIRLALGLAIALALAPALPPHAPIAPASWTGLLVLASQTLIGIALGFTMRVAFAAVDVAGDLIGLQMGLSFAVFYDPQNASESPIVAEVLGLLTLLIFLALNGHLMMLALLAQSFSTLPIGAESFTAAGWGALARGGASLFSLGVLLSLPLIAALLITNIALGVLTKAAPQLNLFAVGFPLTIVAGFVVLALAMPYFGSALDRLFAQGFDAMQVAMKMR